MDATVITGVVYVDINSDNKSPAITTGKSMASYRTLKANTVINIKRWAGPEIPKAERLVTAKKKKKGHISDKEWKTKDLDAEYNC